ncbi:MAG: hypothetical protein KF799_14685 [Bdellovibrionales bacterium]|nr:hypothetical protein [Bdellovibrionales bacterium]
MLLLARTACLILALCIWPAQAEPPTIEERVLRAGDYLEKKIDKAAEKIDITLAGKKYTKKTNPSSVDVRQSFSWQENGRYTSQPDFSINLRLPNVEKRWQLRFSTYDEESESRDRQQRRVRTRPRQRDYGAGLLFLERLGSVKAAFIPRVQLKDPLQVNYVLRFESSAEWKPVRFIPRIDLFADPLKGTGEFVSFEVRIELNERTELGLVNTEEYMAKDNYFTTQHEISIDHQLNDYQAIGSAAGWLSHNKPVMHADTFTYSWSFAQVIYRNRLSASVSPFLQFPKSLHFKGVSGISFGLHLAL